MVVKRKTKRFCSDNCKKLAQYRKKHPNMKIYLSASDKDFYISNEIDRSEGAPKTAFELAMERLGGTPGH